MPRPHLLLADSDSQGLQILEVSLRKAGFQVTATTDGRDALVKAQALLPDLVLSELDLPSLDGFGLLAALRAHEATAAIPVAFLTQDASVERRVRALELGVVDYLSKPIYLKEIVARVRIHLQRRQREQLLAHPAGDLEGGLADMGLVDLLQSIGGRTGVVTCTSPRGETATLWLTDGRIVDAALGRLEGAAAFFRLLVWSDGQYAVRFEPHDRAARIATDTQALLMEGLRRLDELGRVLEGLPGLEAIFEVDFVALALRLGDIPDEVNAVLRLVDGRRDLRQILDESPFEDTSTLSVIARLNTDRIIRAAWIPAERTLVPSRPSTTPRVESAPVATAPAAEKGSAIPLGKDGKPLRGAALARALAAESKRRHETPAPAPSPVADEPEPSPVAEALAAIAEAHASPVAAEPAPPLATPSPELEILVASPQVPALAPPAEASASCAVCGSSLGSAAAPCPTCGTSASEAPALLEPSADASSWAGPVEVPVESGILAELLAGDGPSMSAQQDRSAAIPVMRYPGRKGARRDRLEAESRDASAIAVARGLDPIFLSEELLRPGSRPTDELIARVAPPARQAEPAAPAPSAAITEKFPAYVAPEPASQPAPIATVEPAPLPAVEPAPIVTETRASELLPASAALAAPSDAPDANEPEAALRLGRSEPVPALQSSAEPEEPVALTAPRAHAPDALAAASIDVPDRPTDPMLSIVAALSRAPTAEPAAPAATEPEPAAPPEPAIAAPATADAPAGEIAPASEATSSWSDTLPPVEALETMPALPAPTAPAMAASETPASGTTPVAAAPHTPKGAAHEADDEDEELAAFLRSRKSRAPLAVGAIVAAGLAVLVVFLVNGGSGQEKSAPVVAKVEKAAPAAPVEQAKPAATAQEELDAVELAALGGQQGDEPIAGLPGTVALAPVEPAKAEPAKVEPAKPEPAKPEPVVKAEPVKPEPVKPEPVVKAEPVKPEPVKPEPVAKAEPAKVEPAVKVAPVAAAATSDAEFKKLLDSALKLTTAEEWSRAIGPLQKALKLKQDAIALRELGKAYYMTDKLDRARGELDKATRLDDKDGEAYMYLGMVNQDLERTSDACRAYRRFLFLEPKGSPRAREIAAVLQNLGC